MTVIRPNSVAGINSITAQANDLTLYTASGASGNLNVNKLTVIGNITGTAATFTGNVTVGGTLTYEDVTNIDSVGIVTARSGVLVGSGQSYGSVDGDTAVYYGDGSNLTGASDVRDTWLYSG